MRVARRFKTLRPIGRVSASSLASGSRMPQRPHFVIRGRIHFEADCGGCRHGGNRLDAPPPRKRSEAVVTQSPALSPSMENSSFYGGNHVPKCVSLEWCLFTFSFIVWEYVSF